MKLSISGRLIEVQYRYCELGLREFIDFAHSCGYDAIELRATQLTDQTTVDDVRKLRDVLDDSGMGVSCIMPPGLKAEGSGLERLKRFAEFARLLNCDTLKAWIGDIQWIQRACDLLEPLRLRLATQIHTGGPFESIDCCLQTLLSINRKNFGIFYDPANLFEAGEEYGEKSVERLGNHILQLSVQNVRVAQSDEPGVWEHQGRYFCRCQLGDPRGLDYEGVFRGLRSIGFRGYITLNEPKPSTTDYESFARASAEYLRNLISRTNGREV